MEMMGYKCIESSALLPELKFCFHALIGFRTMKNWGIVLDCRKQELSLQADMRHQCLQLEDGKAPSNRPHLIEITTSSQSQVSGVDENTEQIHSVFEDVVRMDKSQDTSAVAGACIRNEPLQVPEDIGE